MKADNPAHNFGYVRGIFILNRLIVPFDGTAHSGLSD